MRNYLWLLLLVLLPFFQGNGQSAPADDTPPQRVVSLAPNITEIIFKIGAGDLLVGRTEFCLYPPAARKVPTVGGYLNVDYEKIVSLQPDLVLMLPNPEMESRLHLLNIKTRSFPDETLDDILESIRRIGRLLGRTARAAEVVAGIQDTLLQVQHQSEHHPPMSTLLVVGRQPGSLSGLYAAGRNTYLSELAALCGGENAFRDVPLRYFEVAKEDLLQRNPAMILEFRVMDTADSATVTSLVEDWNALPLLQAVQHHRIYIFTERYFLIPGPRVTQAAMRLFDLFQQAAP